MTQSVVCPTHTQQKTTSIKVKPSAHILNGRALCFCKKKKAERSKRCENGRCKQNDFGTVREEKAPYVNFSLAFPMIS
uniref:Uncharacterized protein n=1 Tax=Anguilla anguilla TaxID=7936 RepID=A0A0E9X9B6_ANGAN